MRCCAGPKSVHPQQASPIPGAEEPWLLQRQLEEGLLGLSLHIWPCLLLFQAAHPRCQEKTHKQERALLQGSSGL